MPDNGDTRDLLMNAATEIVKLRRSEDQHKKMIADLSSNITSLEMKIILMDTKIQDMEEIMEGTVEQVSEAQQLLENLRSALSSLKNMSSQALAQAKNSSSVVEMVTSLYNVASKARLSSEFELIDEAEQYIVKLRERVKSA